MRDYNGEEILVIPRELFDELGSFQGIESDIDRYLEALLNPANNFFMDRGKAEEDPSFKQIIPYALFHHEGQYLHYTRGKSGGESRLHAQGSVGIGGHINPIDERADPLGRETYLAGVEREIDEELNISGAHRNRIVALLNDDSNDVGKVHLGVVHVFELENNDVSSAEDALANLAFQSAASLRGELYRSLETWSRFCVDKIVESPS
ncbi:MAG: putative NUDIX family phosphoesterase [Akkermansiaceae bacterium]|mgnify:CR=1 FL=1|jgi:predicted NUDIX family phosphoesterase|tara:strand:- start:11097 stop:11717 length:621 start_codon:yes stop_codon:yes gene_type:complete